MKKQQAKISKSKAGEGGKDPAETFAEKQEERAVRHFREAGLKLSVNVPLNRYCSFAVGGPAAFFFEPASAEELALALRLARREALPVSLLGRGSNVLISDQGVSGLLIHLGASFARIRREGAELLCEAGADLYQVAATAAREGLTGFEAFCGIPGSVGGAVAMNAGAYELSLGERIRSVEYVSPEGEILNLDREQLDFAYRHSWFSEHEGTVANVRFCLEAGDPRKIYERMAEVQAKRRKSQPLGLASAGSSFKRPAGHFAGKLISDSGLKGWRQGSCGVSALHAGFIVNYGGATASELEALFRAVRLKVLADSGVCLEAEVRKLGNWEEMWI